MNRKTFLQLFLAPIFLKNEGFIHTVNGKISIRQLGKCLIHEHILVDFIGADKITFERWNREKVVEKVIPFLNEVKALGYETFFDCTPNFLGRDPLLYRELSQKTGLQIITNTGLYGANGNKHLPKYAFEESDVQLAERWINEFENGIEKTDIKPGFIKIGVDATNQLSELHKKLVRAAAITHKATGLTICSHTGFSKSAFEQVQIIKDLGVSPNAFVWVHAQNETQKNLYLKAAKEGFWISLDGIGWGNFDMYAQSLDVLKVNNFLKYTLISHDAGWYHPEKDDGGEFKAFDKIDKELIPRLKKIGFTNKHFKQLLIQNPQDAFAIRKRLK
jgi:phosphotriesterase-related protein